MKFSRSAKLIAVGLATSAPATAQQVPYCGFWDFDMGRHVTLRMPMYQGRSGFSLNFDIDLVKARLPSRISRVGVAHFTIDEDGDEKITYRSMMVGLALTDALGSPIILRSVDIHCGSSVVMKSMDLIGNDQLQVYKSRRTLPVHFLDRNAVLLCQTALSRSNRLVLDVVSAGNVVPQFQMTAKLPVGPMIDQARQMWRSETEKARTGRCDIHPVPPVPT